MQVLVTGVAGFIGFHAARALLAQGAEVIGIDNLSPYYDVALKEARLDRLARDGGAFHYIQADISGRECFTALRARYPGISHILHLAAQPGVRQSSRMPEDYISANVTGQLQVLEFAASLDKLEHLVYASSSSVYGNSPTPFREDTAIGAPLSFYGVTKRSGELMALQYGRQHGLPITGVRPFTCYGPFGRPDMAYYRFTQALYAGEEIVLYHRGEMWRDFTYIDDMVGGILAALSAPPPKGEQRIANLGNGAPESVKTLLGHLEELTGRKAVIRHAERSAEEPLETYASIAHAREWFGFSPQMGLKDGLARFVAWFCDYHGVS